MLSIKKNQKLYFFRCRLLKKRRSGADKNGDEYVPEIIPTKSAITNQRIVSPPSTANAVNIIIVVKELLSERGNVSVIALLII